MNDKSAVVSHFHEVYKSRGYVTEDEVINVVLENDISYEDINFIVEKLQGLGVLILDEAPKEQDTSKEDIDARQVNYKNLFSSICKHFPELKTLIKKVQKIPPPQRGEWQKLIEQSKTGNKWAFNRLFEMYLRTVISIAWNMYKKYNLSLSDAIQNGCLGLIYAINKFDITEHNTFPGYFPLAVSNFIRRNIDFDVAPIFSFPAIFHDAMLKIYPIVSVHICDKCENSFLTCPKLIDKIIEELECDKKEAEHFLLFFQEIFPVDEIDNTINIFDLSSQEEKIHQSEVMKIINQSFEGLSEREEFVLRMRMGIGLDEPMSLIEIGNKMNVTRERVRQIETKAFNKFKHPTRLTRIKQLFNNFLK